jgi:hypothetical protein
MLRWPWKSNRWVLNHPSTNLADFSPTRPATVAKQDLHTPLLKSRRLCPLLPLLTLPVFEKWALQVLRRVSHGRDNYEVQQISTAQPALMIIVAYQSKAKSSHPAQELKRGKSAHQSSQNP